MCYGIQLLISRRLGARKHKTYGHMCHTAQNGQRGSRQSLIIHKQWSQIERGQIIVPATFNVGFLFPFFF